MKRRLQLSTALALALVSSGAAFAGEVDSASDGSVVEVRARLLASSGSGPTREIATAGNRLRLGDQSELKLFAGVFAFGGRPFCSHGSGRLPPEQGQEGARHYLRWLLGVQLVAAEPDAIAVELDWSRTEVEASAETSLRTEQLSLQLSHGERRLLDLASFQGGPESECADRRYAVEVETRYVGDPRRLGRLLEYDVWFVRTTEDGIQTLGRQTLAALPGEEASFRFQPPESKTLLGWSVEGSEEVAIYGDCGGTLRAWLRDDDGVLVLADTSFGQQRRQGDGEPVAMSVGRGRKRFESRLGETTEIRFPAASGRLALPAEELRLAEPAPRGLTVEGGLVALELAELYEGVDYSIRIRVRDPSAEPD